MTRPVNHYHYPTSDDDLGDMGYRNNANPRVMPAPKKTIFSPKTDALVPKVKATASTRRIRRLKTRDCLPGNPLFKSWTEGDNSPFEAPSKKAVPLLGRRMASRLNIEEGDGGATLGAPTSPAATLVPITESHKASGRV